MSKKRRSFTSEFKFHVVMELLADQKRRVQQFREGAPEIFAPERQYWSAFSAVLESKRAFILVYGPWQYAVLPKRDFPSAESIEKSLRLFREHISTFRPLSDRQ